MPDQASRLRKLANRRKLPAAGRPFVVTVTSGKGGVGKSTVALNLAVLMSDLGRKVVLFDADANLAGLDVMLGVAPRHRFSDVLRGEKEIEEILVSPFERLSLVPGASGETDFPQFGALEQQQVMEDLLGLEQRYDVLVVDTSAGLTTEVIGYAEWADDTLLVTTPDPTAIIDAYAMLKVVTAVRADALVHLVMNSVQDPREGEEAAGKLQHAVGHFLRRELRTLAMIPDDPHVMRALRAQTPLVRAYPKCGAALSLRSIAEQVLDRQARQTGRLVNA